MKPSKTRQPFCHSVERMGKQGDVLMPDAALEIGIAHLMSFTQIAKGNAIRNVFAQPCSVISLQYILPMVMSIRRLLK